MRRSHRTILQARNDSGSLTPSFTGLVTYYCHYRPSRVTVDSLSAEPVSLCTPAGLSITRIKRESPPSFWLLTVLMLMPRS